MIYYGNTDLKKAHMVFIGRWSPFHRGHISMIEKKIRYNSQKPTLILVRNTSYDQYSSVFRAEVIKIWMKKNKIKGTIMIIPDIEGVYWGRKVGYKTQMLKVDKKTKNISATNIRNGINNGDKQWKKMVALKDLSYLLTPKTARIMEEGLVVWLTGCPCAGKTTISKALGKKIKSIYPHLRIEQLDGDVIRNTPIAQGIGFSPEDRALHIKRMGQMAKILADQGVLVVAAFVSPDRQIRNKIKKLIGKKRFIEVYVKASLDNRLRRDKKGLYKKAQKGEIKNLTGFNASYDEPLRPNLICDTDKEKIKESVEKVFRFIFK